MKASCLIFGYGFIGDTFAGLAHDQGYDIIATARTPEKRQQIENKNFSAIDPGDKAALAHAIARVDGVLIAPAPDDDGCPAFAALSGLLADLPPKWLGYLSTTGVYGDRGGGWVWEDSALEPTSTEGRRRITAEGQWQGMDRHRLNIFRLPGLYGPGRNVLERLMDGTARRIHKPGHVFSRLHHYDCATALLAGLSRDVQGVFNLCDDMPAPADEVLAYAARLSGLPLPPEIAFDDPALSPAMQRFYRDNKRVSNARAKAVLNWRPRFPIYHEGLNALWATIQSGKSA